MNKAKIELIHYSSPEKRNDIGDHHRIFKYHVEHNNGETSLDQVMTIESNSTLTQEDWSASIELGNFPLQRTPHNAAIKLADWLERLSAAIRCGDYHEFDRNGFVDCSEQNEAGTDYKTPKPPEPRKVGPV